MLFTSLLPWMIVLYLEKENGVDIMEKNISKSINEDLREVCSSNYHYLKKVKLLDVDGNRFMKNWLIKFYLYADTDKNESRLFAHKKRIVFLKSDDVRNSKKLLNLRLCSDNRLLLFKLEVVHSFKTRAKRSSSVTNTLQQVWSSDTFQQKYTDEKGLEITVKLPRGVNKKRHHLDKSKEDEIYKSTTIPDTESIDDEIKTTPARTTSTASPSTTTTTTSYLLSETCQRYKMTIESVLFWSHNQLDKLRKGEIEDSECSTKVTK